MIFPKSDHFKVTMYASAFLGVWPFIFANNPSMRTLYHIYSKFTFSYYIFFIFSSYMELVVLLLADVLEVEAIVGNLCITLLYSVILIRVHIIRGEDVKGLTREAIDLEELIYQCQDEEMIGIYEVYARQSRVSNIIFMANVATQAMFFFIRPHFLDNEIFFDESANATIVKKHLPLSSWFPFDPQEHYFVAYSWQIFDGIIGASYVMVTDIFAFSLMIFPLGQIKVLIHVLRNFDKYVSRTRDRLQCGREEASFLTLRECILKHKDIIRYVNTYNDAMKNVMVLDFLESSVHLASIVIPLVMAKINLFNFIFYTEFVICMLIRLLVYYGCGNEIMLQSSNISMAIWESEWHEEPQKVKQMMLMMIMRCNKPLVYEIGPFSTMTWRAFLGILKATYSYTMIARK